MLKRGLLFLLVFIIFLDYGLAQDSCLAVPQNPSEEQLNQLITEAATRIWNVYSQIPKYSGDNNEILKAALIGLNSWEPEPQYAILANYKERIVDEMRRLAGGSGSCIDDYSLNAKDDCWNQDALCIENKCVKFDSLGIHENILSRVKEIKNEKDPFFRRANLIFFLGSNSNYLGARINEATTFLIRFLETEIDVDTREVIVDVLRKIKPPKAVPALIRALE